MPFDLVIHNGHVVAGTEILPPSTYIGIKHGLIATMSTVPLDGDRYIDAQGGYITPGGIDSHVHLDTAFSLAGDDFESGSRSAVAGGTTTIIAFALQKKKETDLEKIIEEYKEMAERSYCDYGYHLILSDPSVEALAKLSKLAEMGVTSVKVYTTYPSYKLDDSQIMDVLLETRKAGVTTMVHAENSDVIEFINAKLAAQNRGEPAYHTISRPVEAEDEASYRVITLAKIIDTPILIVHMSTEAGLTHVENSQRQNIPIYAETCPQYLLLTSEHLEEHCHSHKNPDDPFEGAKYICSPPLRQNHEELDAVWSKIENGTVTIFSSDHATARYDDPKGKKIALKDGIPHYVDVPNGMPGVETRLPLLWCYGVETGRITPQKFVEICSSNPAKLYGIKNKGAIAVGYDADFTVWYPKGKIEVELKNEMLHHAIDYTPYEGMKITNWPRYTVLRGKVVWDRDIGLLGEVSDGKYLHRGESLLKRSMKELNPIFS